MDSIRLVGAKMRNTKMDRVILHQIDLQSLDLSGASLIKTVMNIVYLKNANLSHADLRGASLIQVDLTGTDLTKANLMGISYDQFTLNTLTKAKLDGAIMSDKLKADLKVQAATNSI
jgi:uncharacterized protein YjbI with pentapeptide repeats